MSNEIVEINYSTGNLSYEKVRTGVLQKREELVKQGYRCAWKCEPDLENRSKLQKGYTILDDTLITAFSKEGFIFTISIFTNSLRAKIHGSKEMPENNKDNATNLFQNLEEITGIHLKTE